MKYRPFKAAPPALGLVFFLCVLFSCDENEGALISLPQRIQDYISNNYSDYKINESVMDTLCQGKAVYEAELEGKKDKEVVLAFDTEGNFLFQETEISKTDLPATIQNTISSNYPGYSKKEATRLDMFDETQQYEVELKQSGKYLEVIFASDGSVLCESDDEDDN